jgi:hypothetical protein
MRFQIVYLIFTILFSTHSFCNETNQEREPISGEDQNKSSWGLEYGTAPTYGFYFGSSSKTKVGFYFDIKGSLRAPEKSTIYKFSKSYATQTLGDPQTGSVTDYTAINVGALFGVFENMSLLGGAGIAMKTEYLKFHDRTGILGSANNYYIEDTSKNTLNLLLGFVFYIEKINLKVQYETGLSAASFGIGGFF